MKTLIATLALARSLRHTRWRSSPLIPAGTIHAQNTIVQIKPAASTKKNYEAH